MTDELFCNTETDRELAGEWLANRRRKKEQDRMVHAIERILSAIKNDKVTNAINYDVSHLIEYVYEDMLRQDASEAEKFLVSVHNRSSSDAYAIHDLRTKYVSEDGNFTIETSR